MAPPVDLRFLRKGGGRIGDAKNAQARGDVFSFLCHIYESVAETLPDFRDEIGSCHGVQIDISDPCQLEMQKALKSELQETDLLPKEKKQRKKNRQVDVNLDRTSATMEERWLPPGTMYEWWEHYKSQSSLTKPGSFVTFWRVACFHMGKMFLSF